MAYMQLAALFTAGTLGVVGLFAAIFIDNIVLCFQKYAEYGRYAILFKNLFSKNWEFSDF